MGLPEELALSGLIPSPEAAGESAPPDGAPEAPGAAPGEETMADPGDTAVRRGPLVAGMLVSLAILFGGGGFLWWRNRDSRYWPA